MQIIKGKYHARNWVCSPGTTPCVHQNWKRETNSTLTEECDSMQLLILFFWSSWFWWKTWRSMERNSSAWKSVKLISLQSKSAAGSVSWVMIQHLSAHCSQSFYDTEQCHSTISPCSPSVGAIPVLYLHHVAHWEPDDLRSIYSFLQNCETFISFPNQGYI